MSVAYSLDSRLSSIIGFLLLFELLSLQIKLLCRSHLLVLSHVDHLLFYLRLWLHFGLCQCASDAQRFALVIFGLDILGYAQIDV